MGSLRTSLVAGADEFALQSAVSPGRVLCGET
jgi:hypothetical protein